MTQILSIFLRTYHILQVIIIISFLYLQELNEFQNLPELIISIVGCLRMISCTEISKLIKITVVQVVHISVTE